MARNLSEPAVTVPENEHHTGIFIHEVGLRPPANAPYRSPAPARYAAGLRLGELPLVSFERLVQWVFLFGLLCGGLGTAHARPVPAGIDAGPDSVEVDGTGLIVLWSDGDVTWRPEERRETRPVTVVIGDRLGPGTLIEAATGAHVILLTGGDQLATLVGPGRWLLETGRLTSLTVHADRDPLRSPRPRLDRLDGYREGPTPLLEPLSSQPMYYDDALPMTLALVHPSAPVLRSARPEIRWHWPYEGGRFDLTIEETDPSGGEILRIVERWRNLDGRAYTPFADLPRGGTYRVSISHTDTRAPGDNRSPIVDRRLVHVLAPTEAEAVDTALKHLDALQVAKRFRPEVDVLRARLLESHGLWDEAEAVWTGLAILYPGKDDVLSHALRLHARSLVR